MGRSPLQEFAMIRVLLVDDDQELTGLLSEYLEREGFEEVIELQIELHNRNIKNILTFLKEEHNIIVCKRTLRNFLKDARL